MKCFDLRSTYRKSQAVSLPKPYPGKKVVKTHQWYEENKYKMLDCVDERMVPKKEKSFLQDQKKGNNPNHDKELKRNMFSAGIDLRETKILQKRHERRLIEQNYNPPPQKTHETELATTVSDTRSKRTVQKKSYEEQPEENEKRSDQDYQPTWRVKQKFKKRKIDVTQQAEEADRSNQNNTEVARMTIASNYDTSHVKIEKKQVEALRKRVTRKISLKSPY